MDAERIFKETKENPILHPEVTPTPETPGISIPTSIRPTIVPQAPIPTPTRGSEATPILPTPTKIEK